MTVREESTHFRTLESARAAAGEGKLTCIVGGRGGAAGNEGTDDEVVFAVWARGLEIRPEVAISDLSGSPPPSSCGTRDDGAASSSTSVRGRLLDEEDEGERDGRRTMCFFVADPAEALLRPLPVGSFEHTKTGGDVTSLMLQADGSADVSAITLKQKHL